MANFNTHLTCGFLASAVLSITAYKAGIINDDMLMICTFVGTIGGLLPDIDAINSKPVKIGFNLLSIIIAFLLVMSAGREQSLIEMFIILALGFGFMRYVVLLTYSKMTVHRGIVHSVPYMAVLSILSVHICSLFMGMNAVNSWTIGLFIFMGSMVHLILDEIYSVNILNMKIKRSFGTALKVFEFKKWHYYLGLYVSLIPLFLMAPSFHPIWFKLSDSITWVILSNSIFP